jgi:UDP-N-acetylmuramate--alanine ligase
LIKLQDIQGVYFIGIGGIGMSALARYFFSKGIRVSGYDKTETALTKELIAAGIPVSYEDNEAGAPRDVQLVVFTPAIPKDSRLLNFFQAKSIPLLKRSEVLGIISNSSFNICVAGTHGKTTITTMVAHILRHSGYGCNAFLGGISVNYNTNFWSDKRNVSVIEADEYDRSFLKLNPDIAIISSMDADHLDIYGNVQTLEMAFIDFAGKVKADGLLISRFGLKRSREMKVNTQLRYSLQNDAADVYASGLRIHKGSYVFNVMLQNHMIDNVTLHMGGMHNVENVIAAITVAWKLGIDNDKIRAAIEAFKGVKRRFEYIIRSDRMTFIDDYAHHPQELKALITGVKALFPDRRSTIIFQPHLFSRTRDFAGEFAEVLDMADQVILLPVYPARELPIEGVTSRMIFEKMKNENKWLLEKNELPGFLKEKFVPSIDLAIAEVVMTAGAGDIDAMVKDIKSIIEFPDAR